MKRWTSLAVSLTLVLSLATPVFAAGKPSLNQFTSTLTYEEKLFHDVKPGQWFRNSVEFAYEKGIMNGVGEGLFQPDTTASLAQAITIAVRMHATYTGKSVSAASDGVWYQPYYDYAVENKLLPPDIKDLESVASLPATRSRIAYLFSAVLTKEDSEKINNRAIPDLDAIEKDYQEAVKTMYAAGIITGKSGGNFDGAGLATRAEIATIAMRLVNKMQRVGYDSQYPEDLVGQEGNVYNLGFAIEKGNKGYYVYERTDGQYAMLEKNLDTKAQKEIYATGNMIDSVTIGRQGLLIEEIKKDNTGKTQSYILKRLDPDLLKSEVIQESKLECTDYLEYGDKIYYIRQKSGEGIKTVCELIERAADGKETVIRQTSTLMNAFTIVQDEIYYACYEGLGKGNIFHYQKGGKDIALMSISENYILSQNKIYYRNENNEICRRMITDKSTEEVLTKLDENDSVYAFNVVDQTVYFNTRGEGMIRTITQGKAVPFAGSRIDGAVLNIAGGEVFSKPSHSMEKPNFFVSKFGEISSQTRTQKEWLNQVQKESKTLSLNSGSKDAAYSSKEIYSRCQSAVFYISTKDSHGNDYATGSGFFIDGEGTAVTNYHVINSAFQATIKMSDGKTYPVEKVLGYDIDTDIAIVKIKASTPTYLKKSEEVSLSGGDRVYAIGSPLGLENTISDGLVSYPERMLYGRPCIQISTPISPGSSGGALLDEYGNVLGITSSGYLMGQNLNFAIPISYVEKVNCLTPKTLEEVAGEVDWLRYDRRPSFGEGLFVESEPNEKPEDMAWLGNGETCLGETGGEDLDGFLISCNTKGKIKLTLKGIGSQEANLNMGFVPVNKANDEKAMIIKNTQRVDGEDIAVLEYQIEEPGLFLVLLGERNGRNRDVGYTLTYEYTPA